MPTCLCDAPNHHTVFPSYLYRSNSTSSVLLNLLNYNRYNVPPVIKKKTNNKKHVVPVQIKWIRMCIMYLESAETISIKKKQKKTSKERRMSRGCGLTHFAAKMFLHMLAVSSVRESVCAQPRVKTLPSTVSNGPPTVCFCPLGCRERNEERCNRGVEGKWIRWQEKPHQSRLPAPQPTVAPHSARRIEPPTCHPSFKQAWLLSQLSRDYPT